MGAEICRWKTLFCTFWCDGKPWHPSFQNTMNWQHLWPVLYRLCEVWFHFTRFDPTLHAKGPHANSKCAVFSCENILRLLCFCPFKCHDFLLCEIRYLLVFLFKGLGLSHSWDGRIESRLLPLLPLVGDRVRSQFSRGQNQITPIVAQGIIRPTNWWTIPSPNTEILVYKQLQRNHTSSLSDPLIRVCQEKAITYQLVFYSHSPAQETARRAEPLTGISTITQRTDKGTKWLRVWHEIKWLINLLRDLPRSRTID